MGSWAAARYCKGSLSKEILLLADALLVKPSPCACDVFLKVDSAFPMKADAFEEKSKYHA